MQERRATQRVRTYIGAQIAYNKRCSTMDCLARNMSRDGARLVFPNTTTVPSKFDIITRQDDRIRRAQTIWRRAQEVGIQFLD